jgi:hypothetical protein
VWVIQIEARSTFACRQCKGPPGSHVTGRFITVIVNRSDYSSTDFAVTNSGADLTQLGQVILLNV